MTGHDVVIAGGGPTGLMLAAELTLAGVDVAVCERRDDNELVGSRAGGIHARTIEMLDQRGVADRFLSAGQTAQAAMLGRVVMDMSDFPTRHPYALGIFQNKLETILAAWVGELGVSVRYGQEITGFTQDADGVQAQSADGTVLHSRYLVGADGGRSVIRKAAGIDFPGWEATRSTLIAEVEIAEAPPEGLHRTTAGVHGLQRLEDARTFRIVTSEQELGPSTEPGLADLSASLTAAYGTDFGVHRPTWISRFTDATRQAAHYRAGRVLIAGDAAHIHYPAGGQGLSLGVQDAVNLGWKLAQVAQGISEPELLDTYEAERHPVTARTLQFTMALAVLQRADERMESLLGVVSELAGLDDVRVYTAGRTSGLDIHYDLGEGHPLLGRRMPDLDLQLAGGGEARLYSRLHSARPLLVNLAEPRRFDSVPRPDRVQLIDASYDGGWELPVLGEVPTPAGVLVRPDGYVAWVAETAGDGGLADALSRWFGAVDEKYSKCENGLL